MNFMICSENADGAFRLTIENMEVMESMMRGRSSDRVAV
jgi:hypothetical protein